MRETGGKNTSLVVVFVVVALVYTLGGEASSE